MNIFIFLNNFENIKRENKTVIKKLEKIRCYQEKRKQNG